MTEVQDELSRLAGLPGHQLRIEWRRQFRSEPPAGLSRELLLRAVSYKVQERAFGALSQATKRALRNEASKITAEVAKGALGLPPVLTPGVRLVREWRGQTHSVAVLELEHGFEYQGRRYRSLTEIAHHITGAHWSGPRFFGLLRGQTKPTATSGRRSPDNAAAEAEHGQV